MPLPVKRKIGSVVFGSGQRQAIPLDIGDVLLSLSVRLKFTITNGATGPVGPLFQTLARLIQRLEVMVGGRDTVWSTYGPDLAARLQYEQLAPGYGIDATVVLTNSAVTTYDVVIPVNFFMPRSRRGDDSALDLRGISTAYLAITWGTTDCADLFTTPNAAVISAVTCNVEGTYLTNVDPKAKYYVRAMDFMEQQLSGTNASFSLLMDHGTGLWYRSFMIVTTQDKIGVNTVLDPGTVRIEAGSTMFYNGDGVNLRGDNRALFNQSALINGVYFVPLTWGGQLSTILDTGALQADLKVNLNATYTSGTTMVRVQREIVRPLKLA